MDRKSKWKIVATSLAIIAIALAFTIFTWKKTGLQQLAQLGSTDLKPSPPPSPVLDVALPPPAASPEATGDRARHESPPSGESLNPPSTSKLREEIKADPHRTPPSFLKFARETAVRIEAAKGSPEKTRRLYEELQSCATSEATASVREYCRVNAEKIKPSA